MRVIDPWSNLPYLSRFRTKAEKDPKESTIADQNDAFRKGDDRIEGKWVLTDGIWCLGPMDTQEVLRRVIEHSLFEEGNDPHLEHDFGAFDFKGKRMFWKIDYYDNQYDMGSPDSKDLGLTRRILTVMLADEY